MAIKINGVVVETNKLYKEYTPEELKALPPLDAKYKTNWRLGIDGTWYKDCTD